VRGQHETLDSRLVFESKIGGSVSPSISVGSNNWLVRAENTPTKDLASPATIQTQVVQADDYCFY